MSKFKKNVLSVRKAESPYPGMVTYLHIKFDIPVSKAINLIEELIGNGYVGKHELVKNLGDEPSTFCFMNH